MDLMTRRVLLLAIAQCGPLRGLLAWVGVGVSGVLFALGYVKPIWICLPRIVGLAEPSAKQPKGARNTQTPNGHAPFIHRWAHLGCQH